METQVIQYLITSVSAIFAYIISKKYIFKYVIQFFKWLFNIKQEFDKQNVNASKELLEIKDKNNNVYEEQIQFLTQQIQTLEERIEFKQAELNKYLDELAVLRQKIVDMQEKICDNQLHIAELESYCCKNIECKSRCRCNVKQD